MRLPKNVKEIIKILQAHGYEAYAVGGCVRDGILGRVPEDWDITTSAEPYEVKTLFRRTFDTGIEHGTITVLLEGEGYEVTTYRVDGKYEDHRRPKTVEFTRSLEEDLLRRDFTINAMAYNSEVGLVDVFSGRRDLQEGIIRCVGVATERFGEDALRILRAIRFAAQLGFVIEEETQEAIRSLSPTLSKISVERIQVELVKLMVSAHPEFIDDAYRLGVTKVILPNWDEAMQNSNRQSDVLELLQNVEADKVLRLTVLFYEMASVKLATEEEKEQFVKKVLKGLKFDNDTTNKVSKLVRFYEYKMEENRPAVRRALHEMSEELFLLHLKVQYGKNSVKDESEREEGTLHLKKIEAHYEEIKKFHEPIVLKDLEIKGSDLIELGIAQGKKIGLILNRLLEDVLEEPDHNKKEYLITLSKKIVKEK